uniref:Glucoamylase n=1 Tax=Trichocladium griseum TaxID=2567926 RepID=Q12623_9PEZI|nr:glucoamylase [Trichocladium griseum]
MHTFSKLLVLGSAVQSALGRPHGSSRLQERAAVDTFINTEKPIAWNKLLANIGPNGKAAPGAAAGVVIASPSRTDPPYFFTWTPDAALVLTGIIESLGHNYNTTLQQVSNPSGTFADGSGLGEAKFNVDLTAFTGEWGRPQRDGPPLRAIALIQYAKWLIANGYKSTAKSVVWPVVKNDLAYTAQYWNETGFDLWEEVPGSSFFTIASSHRALTEGAYLAAQLDTECPPCTTVAPQVLCFQQAFWNSKGNYVVSTSTAGEYRSGKDANSILASIHNFDPEAGCDNLTFQPCSERALANHKAYVDSFRNLYAINKGIAQGKAVAVGRYSEDVYYNGNPWYLANFAAAEQLYDAIYVWNKQGSITVTSVSLPFFRDLVSSVSTGTYSKSSSTFTNIVNAVKAYADGFIEVAAKYTPSNGALAEQYDRNTGKPDSAADLTWSYSAFLSAIDRRAGLVPPSWRASVAKSQLPSTCSRIEVAGTYVAATSTSFPSKQTPNPSAAPSPSPYPTACADASEVYVTFNERVSTAWGETIKVVGNVPALGNWDTSKAVTLSASGYKSNDPLWSITVPIKATGSAVQYKYIKVGTNGKITWESDPNRSITLQTASSAGKCAAQTVNDSWR